MDAPQHPASVQCRWDLWKDHRHPPERPKVLEFCLLSTALQPRTASKVSWPRANEGQCAGRVLSFPRQVLHAEQCGEESAEEAAASCSRYRMPSAQTQRTEDGQIWPRRGRRMAAVHTMWFVRHRKAPVRPARPPSNAIRAGVAPRGEHNTASSHKGPGNCRDF